MSHLLRYNISNGKLIYLYFKAHSRITRLKLVKFVGEGSNYSYLRGNRKGKVIKGRVHKHGKFH